jgi:uncharacterized membrane protein
MRETRLPMAIGVLFLMALAVLSPESLSIMPGWLLAMMEGVLLVVLLLGDPGHIDRATPWLRRASIALVTIIVLSTFGSVVRLVADLVTGSPLTSQADELFLVGAKVWLGNNVAFAILYWEFDSDGPAVRAHYRTPHPDFAFPQTLSPDVAPKGWRPRFPDYLYLAFTNASAFSPTDVLPLTFGAKLAMGVQALISFAVVGLIIARAVNTFR